MEHMFMPHQSFYASGLLALAIVTLSGRTATAQTTAVGPYYATPSWDQTFACATPTNCPRFIVLSNFNGEAVLDRETGLVWERSPSPFAGDWTSALVRCLNLQVGNRLGWRFPTFQELRSLVDPTTDFLPAGHPFSDVQQLKFYWSSTGFLDNPDLMYVAVIGPVAASARLRTEQFLGWCVRGGLGVGAQ
jgi:hypothetical protein